MAYTGSLNDKYYSTPKTSSSSMPGGLATALEEAKKGKARLANQTTSSYTAPRSTASTSSGSGGGGGSSSAHNDSSSYSDYDSAPDYYSNQAYDAYQEMLSQYQREAEEREARARAEAEARLQAQREAAQHAYNRGMDYLNNAYNTKVSNLGSNYNSTVDQLNNSYNNSANKVNADAARALNEAYINRALSEKNLNQVLSAQGISGGATESTLAKLLTNYGNSRNGIENQKASSISELDNTLANNLAGALQQYNTAMSNADSEKMQYAMNLENALANNEIAAQDSYFNALQGSDDGYLNLLQNYLSNMASYAFSPTVASNQLKYQTALQKAQQSESKYNPYVAAQQRAADTVGGLTNGISTSQTANNSNYLQALLRQLNNRMGA